MGFTIEQNCPQCGAPVELDETDHLMKCPYCDVKSFMFASDYYRFVMPPRVPIKELIYIPYLHFKGPAYYAQGQKVASRIVDITDLGAPLSFLPQSLGMRTQTVKMQFVTPETQGSFLKFTMNPDEIMERAARLPAKAREVQSRFEGIMESQRRDTQTEGAQGSARCCGPLRDEYPKPQSISRYSR